MITISADLAKAADYWSAMRPSGRTRWWSHAAIHRHINRLVCTQAVDGAWAGLNIRMRALMPPGGFQRGISIGCGEGSKEINLIKEGIVQCFDLFEISQKRVEQCIARAKLLGVSDKVRVHNLNAFEVIVDEKFDLVY